MSLPLTRRRPLWWPALALTLLLAAPDALAQVGSQAHPAAVYRHAEPGQPTMQVRVWGAVRAPGLYLVARDTDVVGLLSLAGGPVQFAESPNIERTLWLRLARSGEEGRQLITEMPLADLTRAPGPVPALQDGDVVSVDVEARQRFGWRDGLQIFSSVGTVAVIVLNIIRLSN